MAEQDLKKCNTPDAVVTTILQAAGDMLNDAENLDSSGMNGEPYRILAHELDVAMGRAVRRIIASGYPVNPELRDLVPRVKVVRIK
jgi:hypothetical protein